MATPLLKLPVKKTAYGPITDRAYFIKVLRQYGQFFGEDLSGPACWFDKSYPCNITLYDHLGWGTHKGLDIPCGAGTPVHASHGGVVHKTSETESQGIGIVIRREFEYETVYWHNQRNLVKVGDIVSTDQLIAYSDNTGFSAGNHLHFECKLWNGSIYQAVDPLPFLDFGENNYINMDEKFINDMYLFYFGRLPNVQELVDWLGKNYRDLLKAMLRDKLGLFD